MAKRSILSVGLELASDEVKYVEFSEKTSLLDWDIVLFRPTITADYHTYDRFEGKPCLRDDESFKLKEDSAHWHREIKQAVENGKTIIAFLPPLVTIFVATGQQEVSGTGRNTVTKRIVEAYNNYKTIPADLGAVVSSGNSISLAPENSDLLSSYWGEFSNISKYHVLLTATNLRPSFITKSGNKTVGAVIRHKNSNGSLLLMPDIDFSHQGFFEDDEDGTNWNQEAKLFAIKMISAAISLDKSLHLSGVHTPEPLWSKVTEYHLKEERVFGEQLIILGDELNALQSRKDEISTKLREVGAARALLFEKAKSLEGAIISALQTLGFSASPYRDSNSEFDVVFESSEGRLIGEAEGKDNKAINIDKLRQLGMNIHEDLLREETQSPAKPVLFGNGYRLQPLADRLDPFTEKCKSAALTSSTALVFTPDLFRVVKYLSANSDETFATACRLAIINTAGRVIFPVIPDMGSAPEITSTS